MKQICSIWFPENEEHFDRMLGETGNYQKDTFETAMEYVKNPKIFYDIGAHVGLWSLMAIKAGFQEIEAYEPNPVTFECLKKNLAGREGKYKAHLHNYGLAEYNGEYDIQENHIGNSGAVSFKQIPTKQPGSNIKIGNISANKMSLHSLIEKFSLKPHETLVKIDTEGMEADCVLGMDKVIYALRPVVVVEQRTNENALTILQQMGMRIVKIVRKDYILTWPPIYEYEYPSVSSKNLLSDSTLDSIDAWKR